MPDRVWTFWGATISDKNQKENKKVRQGDRKRRTDRGIVSPPVSGWRDVGT